jgi:hypothetical protein
MFHSGKKSLCLGASKRWATVFSFAFGLSVRWRETGNLVVLVLESGRVNEAEKEGLPGLQGRRERRQGGRGGGRESMEEELQQGHCGCRCVPERKQVREGATSSPLPYLEYFILHVCSIWDSFHIGWELNKTDDCSFFCPLICLTLGWPYMIPLILQKFHLNKMFCDFLIRSHICYTSCGCSYSKLLRITLW